MIDTESSICYNYQQVMIQKQIALPEDLNQQITQRAKLLQEPEERVIHDLLSLGLVTASKSWRNGGEALRTLGKLSIHGPADLAKNHDDDDRSSKP